MSIKSNIQSTGASYGHSQAVCGELAPYVTAAGTTQATATLLRMLTRHIVTAGTGGVIIPPGIGNTDQLQFSDEMEITNAAGVTISVYPPLGMLFLGSATNAPLTLQNGYSVSVLVDSATRLIPRYYATASGAGSVTSVGLSLPAEFTVTGTPVTNTGTLSATWANETANTIFSGPTSGGAATPGFRAMVSADLPTTAVTPGTYTNTTLTVDSHGRLTAASNGSVGSGTVTSVGLSLPAFITVSGSPVTTTGTLTGTLASQSQNLCFASPNGSSGTPTFRALVLADLPGNVVSTTGSPSNGNLVAFTGGATVSNSNLSGDVTTTNTLVTTLKANLKLATIWYEIKNGGSVIGTGLQGYLQVEFDCTITANTLLADTSTTSVVNIWKCTYAQFDAGSSHPVSGDKITSSTPPTITAAVKSTDSTLTSWTTTISAGDILAFNVDSNNNATRLDLMLKVSKT